VLDQQEATGAMPTYRYRCSKCGEETEVWQSITDPALTTHDECGGELVKVLSPAGIVLKGSGFYKTDSRGNGKGAKKSSESTSDTSSAGAATKSSDTGSGSGSGSKGTTDSSGSGGAGKSGSSTSPSGSSGSKT
jgi:putative FmdB family regulatory protein